MRKVWVFMLVAMISLGLMVVMGGCGDGGGGGGTPKSSAAYAGSNMSSVIDSTSVWSYAFLLDDIGDIMSIVQDPPVDWVATENEKWGYTDAGDYSIDGSGGGTYSESWEYSDLYNSTQDGDLYTQEHTNRDIWEGSFNSFMDSGDEWPYTLEGEGSFYTKDEYASVYTTTGGIPMALAPSGTESGSNYVNYSGFEMRPEWAPDWLFGMSGHVDQKYDADYVAGLCDSTLDADISYSEVTSGSESYYGLLNTKASVAYDGSDSTVTGSGTVCGEGDAELYVEGCVDFVIDAVWENTDICGGEGPGGFPDSGTFQFSTMDAKAMYDFGATSDPYCFKYLVDADNDNAYEYSDIYCD